MAEAPQISGSEQFEAEIAAEQPCVVEFWMSGCPACARFADVFAEMAAEFAERANLRGLEAREHLEIARKHGVSGVPTVIMFKCGEEVQRKVGAQSKEEFREWLEPALV
ncbi:MAG: thioredoxin family protein [Armatimonadota bacterium]